MNILNTPSQILPECVSTVDVGVTAFMDCEIMSNNLYLILFRNDLGGKLQTPIRSFNGLPGPLGLGEHDDYISAPGYLRASQKSVTAFCQTKILTDNLYRIQNALYRQQNDLYR